MQRNVIADATAAQVWALRTPGRERMQYLSVRQGNVSMPRKAGQLGSGHGQRGHYIAWHEHFIVM